MGDKIRVGIVRTGMMGLEHIMSLRLSPEVEIAAMKEEYDEQHRAALAKCETHRLETEQQAAEAAAALGDERADLHRQIAERRSDFERERAEFDRMVGGIEGVLDRLGVTDL